MINESDFTNYRIFLNLIQKDIFNLLALGCGEIRTEDKIGAKNILGVEWADSRLAVAKEKITVIKYDIRDITSIIPDKSFDIVTMFDVLEHINKRDGLKLLKELEKKVKNQIVIFAPVQPEIINVDLVSRMQHERKKKNLSMGHHLSTWIPEEFEKLGFQIIKYSPNYHKKKGYGAVFCIKNLK